MIKPWSISTTVRSPDRLRGFLSVLAQLDGEIWDSAAQMSFQIRLIQTWLFGICWARSFGELSHDDKILIASGKDMPYARAEEIFADKKYKNPSRRANLFVRPLVKYGFASVTDGVVRITGMGKLLLAETKDCHEVMLRFLLKWELPNELEPGFPAKHGYNIKPFVGALRLIRAVNRLCAKDKVKAKGISFDEFRIFALTLIDYRDIEKTAEEIMAFRRQLAKTPAARRDALIDGAAARLRPNFNLQHSRDYADNAIRYFRMTKYVRFRDANGNGHVELCGDDVFMDLDEEFRQIELDSLFARDDGRPIFYESASQAAA